MLMDWFYSFTRGRKIALSLSFINKGGLFLLQSRYVVQGISDLLRVLCSVLLTNSNPPIAPVN